MKIYFIVLIGLPGSGKTDLCSKLCFKLSSSNKRACLHVEFDKYIRGIDDFRASRLALLKKIENAAESISKGDYKSHELSLSFTPEATNSFDDVFFLLDDNMFYCSMRYDVYKLVRGLATKLAGNDNIFYAQIYLKIPVDVCIVNNATRQRAAMVPVEIIKKMSEKIEPPKSSYFWEKSTLTVTENTSSDNIILMTTNFIQSLIPLSVSNNNSLELEEQRKSSRAETLTSILHQCELALRQLISHYMNVHKEKDTTAKQELISYLQKIKKEILYDVKHEAFFSVDDGKEFATCLFSSYAENYFATTIL